MIVAAQSYHNTTDSETFSGQGPGFNWSDTDTTHGSHLNTN